VKGIDGLVAPLAQCVGGISDAQHVSRQTVSRPFQAEQPLLKSLTQSWPATYDVRDHLFEVISLQLALQLDLAAKLHQYAGALLVSDEESVSR
jgi:hypothetical protein